MKHVMVIAREGNAVGFGLEKVITKSALGTFMPNLEVIKEVLLSIPTEPSETVNIHLMNSVQGIMSGSAVEYVKTGKTVTNGTPLSQEEIKAFTEVYKLYAERILNVKWTLVKYIKTNDVALQTMKQNAYKELEAYERVAGKASDKVITTTVDPDKELREMFDAQIKEAMASKDMALVKDLMAMRKELKDAEVVTTKATTSNRTQAPTFESAIDKQIEASIGNPDESDAPNFGEETDTPINFQTQDDSQQQQKW